MMNNLTPYLVKHQRNERGLTLRELSKLSEVREQCLRLYEANRYDLGSYALERLSEDLSGQEEASCG